MFKTKLLGHSLKSISTQAIVGVIAKASLPFVFAALTACSTTTAQNSSANSSPAASTMSGMDHSTMDHGSTGNMMHNMDLGTTDANYDLRFIDAMRIHHRGAIDMANQAEQKSQRSEIKSLARNIIITQNREENELLTKWRKQWYPNAPQELVMYGGKEKSTMPMSAEYRQMMSMQRDLGVADAQFDLRFMNAMISHHEGAIVMAKDALQKSNRPEIKQLAQEIANSQQAEVDQMKQWRKGWYQQ